MRYKKIRISGGSGSGKTYLGKLLERKTKIKFTDLDSFRYDFSKTHKFDVKIPLPKAKKLLSELIKKEKWIVDGTYYNYSIETYDQADLIIYLRPLFKRILNTTKRFIRRFKEGKNEGFFNFLSLTKYNFSSINKWQVKRYNLFKEKYANKFYCFKSADEAYAWFIKQN